MQRVTTGSMRLMNSIPVSAPDPALQGLARRPCASWLPLLMMVFVLGGCATVPPLAESLSPGVRGLETAAWPGEPLPASTDLDDTRPAPVMMRGSDRVVSLPASRPAVEWTGDAVSLRFERAPITDVVHAVLGDILEADYTIHQPVEGQITVHTHRPVPREQIPALLDTLMAAHGVAITRDARGLYHVGRSETLRTTAPALTRAGQGNAGFGTVIVPLRHVGAAEMATILRPVAPADAILRVDTVRNLLVLAGSRSQVDGWLDMVATFDVDLLAGMSVGIFPIEHASVAEIELALRAVLGQGASTASLLAGSPTAPPPEGEAAGEPVDLLEGAGPLSGLLRVIPIERLNSLLVVTPRAEYLDKVRVWIERLDQPAETEHGQQLFVYPVQNGSAAHLAGLLNGLFGVEGAQPVTPQADSGVAPGLMAATTQSAGFAGVSASAPGSTPPLADARQPRAETQITQVSLGPRIRVVADEHNNALLVFAARRDYRTLEVALRRLDVAPTQVLVEASIVEVSLNDELKYGLQWYFSNTIGGGRTGEGLLNLRNEGDIGPEQPGFSYTLSNSAGMVRAVLNMLAAKSRVNVISTPSVMVQDNHTATIHVGNQQPVRTSETVTDGGRSTSIEFKDTGVMLSVTPSVNAGGMVTMNVHQSVTDVGQIDPATEQRSFLQRQLSSRIAVRSGETVVLGGLIRDNSTRGRQGIPLLHDIPVVGNLFGGTAINTDRTELLVMITPRVLQREADHRAVLDELKSRMHGLQSLLAVPAASSDAASEASAR